MNKIAYVTPASAVAVNGTFTAAYPTDTTAGDFASYGHKIFARGLQAYFTQDNGQISVSFGASDITVTYKGSTSIPANSMIVCEFNIAGKADAPKDIVDPKRAVFANLMKLDLGAPDTADADGIVESQDLTSAGVYSTLAFNGVYGDPYGNAYAILDVPRNVVASWTGTAILTVTSEDEYGDVIVEKSGSGTSFTGKKAVKRITSIAVSANVTSLTVGTGDVLGLPVFVEKVGQILGELKDGVLQGRAPGRVYLQGLALEAAVDGATGLNFVTPVAGVIRKVSVISQTGTTTGGDVTAEINTVAVNGLTVTVASSSSEGDVDSDTPTKDHASTIVAAGDRVELQFGSAFSGATDLMAVVEIDTDGTALLDGTFVAGVQTTPTATTGDVRGTYDPASDCNGSRQFALLAYVPDPDYRGVDNYDG